MNAPFVVAGPPGGRKTDYDQVCRKSYARRC